MALVLRCRVVNALGSGADYHNKALCSVNTSVALPGIPFPRAASTPEHPVNSTSRWAGPGRVIADRYSC